MTGSKKDEMFMPLLLTEWLDNCRGAELIRPLQTGVMPDSGLV